MYMSQIFGLRFALMVFSIKNSVMNMCSGKDICSCPKVYDFLAVKRLCHMSQCSCLVADYKASISPNYVSVDFLKLMLL